MASFEKLPTVGAFALAALLGGGYTLLLLPFFDGFAGKEGAEV